MCKKYNIDDLINAYSVLSKHSQEESSFIVYAFLETIKEGLNNNKFVNISGFGTFKYELNDQMKSSLHFYPDEEFNIIINRPFNHFTAIELDEEIDEQELKLAEEKANSFFQQADILLGTSEIKNDNSPTRNVETQNEEKKSFLLMKQNNNAKEEKIQEFKNKSISDKISKTEILKLIDERESILRKEIMNDVLNYIDSKANLKENNKLKKKLYLIIIVFLSILGTIFLLHLKINS